MNPARFAIRNPILVNLVALFAIVAGLAAYQFSIRKEVFPPADIGVILVQTHDPRALPPQDVEREITVPLENEIQRIEGIDELLSISGEGSSQIFVRLESGFDADSVSLKIQAEVDKAQLPEGTDAPVVQEILFPLPVLSVAITADAAVLAQMRARAQPHELGEDSVPYALERRLKILAERIENELRRIDGVSRVSVAGERERRLWVEPTPANLRQHGLSLRDLAASIGSANARVAGGTLSHDGEEVAIRTGTLFADDPRGIAHAARQVVLRTSNSRSPLRVERVATVVDGFEDFRSRALLYTSDPPPGTSPVGPNGAFATNPGQSQVAIILTVFKRDTADFIKLSDTLQAYLASVTDTPEGVAVVVYDDRSQVIRDRLAVVETNGLIGLVIVVVVLLLFLDYRMALMTALAVPVSLLGAIAVMTALGYSANILSLFGLIIALGLVVDDGIIVCENAYRYMEQGMAPIPAAIRGTQEVIGPVVASILTTIAAFAPLLFWGGVTGQFLGVIPVAVIAALAISLIESLWILPAHIAEWAHDPEKERNAVRRPLLARGLDWTFGWSGPMRRGFQGRFRRFRKLYVFVLVRALRWRYVVTASAALVVSGGSFVFGAMAGTAFLEFPQTERFYVNMELPEGASVLATSDAAREVEGVIREVMPAGSFSVISTSVGSYRDWARLSRSGKNRAGIVVELRDNRSFKAVYGVSPPTNYRTRTTVDGYLDTIRQRLSALPLSAAWVFAEEGGPPEGAPVEVRLRSDSFDAVREASREIERELAEIRGLISVASNLQDGGTEYQPMLDVDRIRALGLTQQEVGSAVRDAFDGITATRIISGDEEIDVNIRLADTNRRTRDDLLYVDIPTPVGPVPLATLVTEVRKVVAPATVRRFDQQRSVLITADVQGISAREGTALARAVVARVVGSRSDIEVSYEGRFQAEAQGFTDLGLIALASVLIIYVILATVLKSFAQPFLIMAAVPLALVGVMIGLFTMGSAISLISMLGAVALVGIIVNDSTVLVDFVNRQRRDGEGRWVALVRGSKLRLRPIVLTSVTTVGGLFTISFSSVLGLTDRESFLAPMGIAISFGLVFGTGLLVIVVPCLYAIYEDVLAWLGLDPVGAVRTERELAAFEAQEQNERDRARLLLLSSGTSVLLPGAPPNSWPDGSLVPRGGVGVSGPDGDDRQLVLPIASNTSLLHSPELGAATAAAQLGDHHATVVREDATPATAADSGDGDYAAPVPAERSPARRGNKLIRFAGRSESDVRFARDRTQSQRLRALDPPSADSTGTRADASDEIDRPVARETPALAPAPDLTADQRARLRGEARDAPSVRAGTEGSGPPSGKLRGSRRIVRKPDADTPHSAPDPGSKPGRPTGNAATPPDPDSYTV